MIMQIYVKIEIIDSNKNCPKGSITPWYYWRMHAIVCKYLHGVETYLNWSRKNQEDSGTQIDMRSDIKYVGRALGFERAVTFDRIELETCIDTYYLIATQSTHT